MLVLAGCGHSRYTYTPGQSHVVRSGETLSVIAYRYGKDYRDRGVILPATYEKLIEADEKYQGW